MGMPLTQMLTPPPQDAGLLSPKPAQKDLLLLRMPLTQMLTPPPQDAGLPSLKPAQKVQLLPRMPLTQTSTPPRRMLGCMSKHNDLTFKSQQLFKLLTLFKKKK